MAYIELKRSSLNHNFDYLNNLFVSRNINWGVVSKILCGNREFLRALLALGIREIHDSRIMNLKVIKSLDPSIQTVYIKPPEKRAITSVIRYADVSFNTEFATIKMLSDEAIQQQKTHKIIIMIEMGDLREGVMGENLVEFYSRVFELPNIEIIGLGANLNCLNGIMPSHDKLIQLSLYKQLIEARFAKRIPWVSGGSSVTIPLLKHGLVPRGINHFRVGETLFLGNDLSKGKKMKNMNDDIFKLKAEIIELTKKPIVPMGQAGTNVAGNEPDINENDYGKTSWRAILDIGLLDINTEHMFPIGRNINISGASSDMIVVDLGRNSGNFRVGDLIPFRLSYMGVLSVMSSDYIEKRIVI
ncbi:MAG: alanine racemase [Bacteroidota bacterium]